VRRRHVIVMVPRSLPLALLALTCCKPPERAPAERAPTERAPVERVERVLLHEDGVENAYPRLSADGREILYQSNRTGSWQLYILDLATGASRALTDRANNNFPDWSGDNARIAFVSDRDGNEEIYIMNRDGSAQTRLTTQAGRDLHPYFSPDGKTLLYNSMRATQFDVFALELASGGERQITNTAQDETCARYSPDGKQIVLLRNDPLADDIWILGATSERNLTATPRVRDGWPMFGADGLVYFSGMEGGAFSIYRMRADGTARERLTVAAANTEDARPFAAKDRLIFNRRHDGAIDIVERTM
jgi:Tol biopolymer transport system component